MTRERDFIETDVVCAGAGIAVLSAVLRILKNCKEKKIDAPSILILEKGSRPGAHVLSGAVINPEPLRELLTPEEFAALPLQAEVVSETFIRLTEKGSFALPFTPPPMKARGYASVCLSELTASLGRLCESYGAEIYTDCGAAELLEKDEVFTGVRTTDRGRDRNGVPTSGFEPGTDVFAKTILLGEGACGLLSQSLIRDRRLFGKGRQTYALGIKELLRVPAAPEKTGNIVHTFGWPLDQRTYGGGFVYPISDTEVSVGLVTALDYRDPRLCPHDLFRSFKAHPVIAEHIRGGEVIGYGAKIIPEGGCFSIPNPVCGRALIVGDAAGLLDTVQLKGVHLAVESGVAAGNAVFTAMWNNWPENGLQDYPQQLFRSKHIRTLRRYRNTRAAFQFGQMAGMVAVGAGWVSAGLLPPGQISFRYDDAEAMCSVSKTGRRKPVPAPKEAPSVLNFDRLTDVYYSGTLHSEDQPCHLRINDRAKCIECADVFNAPCTRFCPAQVYEWPEGTDQVQISPSNCLHCMACSIKCPLKNIDWLLPESGGPAYAKM